MAARACPVDLSAKSTYFESIPHTLLTRLRNETPVFWHEGKTLSYWAVLKHEDVRVVSRDNATFSSQRSGVFYESQQSSLSGSLILADPPEHTQLRQVVDQPFAKSAVAELEEFLRRKCRAIMDAAARKGTCDFVYDLAAELPLAAISEIMAVAQPDRNELLELGDAVIRAVDPEHRNAALSELGIFGRRLAEARDAGTEGRSDLVSRIRTSNRQGCPLSEEEFGGQFAQIAVAANETTRTLISNIALEFIRRPTLFDELAADPGLIPQAIEEFLRWVTPIYYMRRTATCDTEIRGQQIRAGDAVVMYYLSANRDEDVFEQPFELDIRRSPNRHLAFGVGRHVCLGQFLARLETRVFLEELTSRFSAVETAGEPVRLLSNITNSWERIPVALTAR